MIHEFTVRMTGPSSMNEDEARILLGTMIRLAEQEAESDIDDGGTEEAWRATCRNISHTDFEILPPAPRFRMTIEAHCIESYFLRDLARLGVAIVDMAKAPWAVTFEGTEEALQQALEAHWPDAHNIEMTEVS